MIVKVQFDTDTPAFGRDAWPELRRVLDKARDYTAECVASGATGEGSLLDSWGNMVGSWAVEDES